MTTTNATICAKRFAIPDVIFLSAYRNFCPELILSPRSADLPDMVAQSKYSLYVLFVLGCLLFFHYFDNKTLADELTGSLPLSRAAFRGNPSDVEAALRRGGNP